MFADALAGELKPIYNFMNDLPGLQEQVTPFLPIEIVRRYNETLGAFDAGRGCPFQCSFCTIINVQGRKSRWRDADDVERLVRANTWRRGSTASSSPTTISRATATGRRSSTA